MKEMGKAYLLLFIIWCLLQGTGADRVKIIPRIWQGDWFAASEVTFGPKRIGVMVSVKTRMTKMNATWWPGRPWQTLRKGKKMMMTSRRRNSA